MLIRVISIMSMAFFVIPLSACQTASPLWPDLEMLRSLEEELRRVDVESAPNPRKAAEGFLQVAAERRMTAALQGNDGSLEYDKALLNAGHCYRLEAVQRWRSQHGNLEEVKQALRLAEEALKQVLATLNDPARRRAQGDAAKMQASLSWIGSLELAYVYLNDASPRYDEGLIHLENAVRALPPDDARLAKLWALEIHVQVAQRNADPAAKTLDLMFERFPDAPELVRACKRVAILLDEETTELVKEKADQAKIVENLRRICRYYTKWLVSAPGLNMRITLADALSVAEALYAGAKVINGLNEHVISFMDLKGRQVKEPLYFREAGYALSLIIEGKVGKIFDRDRLVLMTRLARCYSFIAQDEEGWNQANNYYENIMKVYNLVTPNGDLDSTVLQNHRDLLGVYLEQGNVHRELGRLGATPHLASASMVFGNLLDRVHGESEFLWQRQYQVVESLVDSSDEEDFKRGKVSFEILERQSPDFDHDQFGMRTKFLELKKKIATRSGDH